jgi:hypothetical protein
MTDGQLTTVGERGVSAGPSYEQIKEMAHYFARSNMFGVSTPEQAFSLLMIAQAEGLHPARALQEYHVIKNKPSLRADAMLGRFQRAGGKVKWIKHEDDGVTAEFTHDASGTTSVSWDMDRAKRAKVTGNDTWSKYPRQMLRARVISEGVRLSYPACILGFYTPEEVSDFDAPREPIRQASAPMQEAVPETEVIDAEIADVGQRLPSVDVSFPDSNGLSNKEIRETYDRLARMVANCNTLDDLQGWLTLGADDLEQLPEEVRISLRGVWKRRRDELKAVVG